MEASALNVLSLEKYVGAGVRASIRETTMNRFEWNDKWSLDLDIVDKQHKNLIEILNKMNNDSISYSETLDSFIDYAGRHFSDEEELMRIYNYQGYLEHKVEHRKFTLALLEVSFKLIKIKKNEDAVNKIMDRFKEFCFAWFNIHFLERDKEFVDFIKGGGT